MVGANTILPSHWLETLIVLFALTAPIKGRQQQNEAAADRIRKLETGNAPRLRAPIVINTWNFRQANQRAFEAFQLGGNALDAVEQGCSQCEIDRCDGTVGWGGSPAETGETTLDAMMMDGETYDVGAVAGLRRVKSAISVARQVLERTNHTLLVGEMATQFALALGFKEESLTSNESIKLHQDWLQNSCQPNYWKNVSPNPRKFCGPYHIDDSTNLVDLLSSYSTNPVNFVPPPNKPPPRYRTGQLAETRVGADVIGHDTIGMVALDRDGRLVSGTSTNGLRYKILGRVGDSPIPGAGSYADREAGAAAATGDGDLIMRFLLSYQAVENLRQGMSAQEAAVDVIKRVMQRSNNRPPYPEVGIVVLKKEGDLTGSFGAACLGWSSRKFPFVVSDQRQTLVTYETDCLA